MRIANFFYKDELIATLWETGKVAYEIHSSFAKEMNVEIVLHEVERMRQIGLEDDFDFDHYVNGWLNPPFPNDWIVEIQDDKYM